MTKNIVLFGFMGSGKTATGKHLAERLQLPFVDVDRWIEQQQGRTIREIFESLGEEAFRQMEETAVQTLSRLKNTVISCGGGTVLRAENVAALRQNGTLFYLKVSADTVKRRLQNDTDRPLLATGRDAAISDLLKKREPLYAAAADVTVDANGTVAETAEQILANRKAYF